MYGIKWLRRNNVKSITARLLAFSLICQGVFIQAMQLSDQSAAMEQYQEKLLSGNQTLVLADEYTPILELMHLAASLAKNRNEAPILFALLNQIEQGYVDISVQALLETLEYEIPVLIENYYIEVGDEQRLQTLLEYLEHAWDIIGAHNTSSDIGLTRALKTKVLANLYVRRVAEIGTLFVDHDATVAEDLRVFGNFFVNGHAYLNDVTISGTINPETGLITTRVLKLTEDPSNGSDFIALQAPAALAASYPLVLPPDIGAANQVLKTDGAGNTFWGTSTSVCSNVLTVKHGTLSGPNEFNSVVAAMASITTNTPTNRFIISVCPGVYVEDTIVMKPYVVLAGTSALATVVEVDAPSKDAIIGSSDSGVEFLTIRGATDPGKAALVYSGGSTGGEFVISNCIIGRNDIGLLQTGTTPFISSVSIKNCTIASDSNFSTGISVSSGPFASLLFLDNFTWVSLVNPNLADVIFATGPQTVVVIRDVTIGAFGAALPGNAMHLQNGAALTLNSAEIVGFVQAINIPNVGIGPVLNVSAVAGLSNVEDIRIDNPLTTGSINATFARVKTFIDPATVISLFLVDPTDGGTTTLGPLFQGDSVSDLTDISPQIQQGSNMGVMFGGGALSIGGVGVVNVGAGTGYLMTGSFPADDLKYVEWGAQSVAVIANTDNYVFIDEFGVAQSSAASPTLTGKIFIGKARTDSGNNIVYLQAVDREATHTASQLDDSWRRGLGNIYISGSIVSASATPPQLDVSNGNYFLGTHEYTPMGGNDIPFITFSRGGANFNIFGPQQNVPFAYDSAPNTLTPLVAGQYARHALYVVGDGVDETYILQYGQQAFPSLIAAQAGGIPPQPGSWTDNIVLIASIIVDSAGIVEIRDERPRLAFRASGVTVVTDHGSLTGLLNDDHPQYLLVNGSRAMIGDLDMGTNAVFNATTYNGVTVEAHASRHLPISGADPLPTQIPLDIGTANSIGIQNTFSRGDHIHAHANQPGGSLHALVTPNPGGVAGFMSAADKTKLDGLGSASYVTDSGTATPVAGVLQVLGGTNITTSGLVDVLTIALDGTVAVGNGGTGVTTFTTNGVLYGNGTSALQVTAAGAANTVLLGNGGAPSFGAVPNAALANSSITLNDGNNITVTGSPVSLGGAATIAVSGTTQYAVQVGNAAGALTSVSPSATSGVPLISNGAAADPSFGTAVVAGGGTGATSFTAYAVLCGGTTSTNPVQSIASVGTAGQVLASNGAGALPTFQSLSLLNAYVQGGNSFGATGTLGLNDANTLDIRTNGATRLSINSDGAVSVSAPTVGVAMAVTGNASASTVSVTSNAAQNSIITSLGAVGTPAYSFIGDTNTGIYSPGADQIRMVTAGADRLRIDASGNTTYTSNYKARAYLGANQTITGAGTQTLQFNTENYDPNSNFNTGTFLYTAPVTGYYFVTVNLSATYSNNNLRTLQLLRNGVTVTGYSMNTSGITSANASGTSFTAIIDLTAGQTLGFQLVNAGGNVVMQANNTNISIHFMSI